MLSLLKHTVGLCVVDTLNNTDVSTLQSIANQCPLSGGSIVWKARALLNSYYGNIVDYSAACAVSNGEEERVQHTTNINNILGKQQSINLYPNPSNGKMVLEYNIDKDVASISLSF